MMFQGQYRQAAETNKLSTAFGRIQRSLQRVLSESLNSLHDEKEQSLKSFAQDLERLS